MKFDVNADYVGKLIHFGCESVGVILRHWTIAGGGPARHRFEIWVPGIDLPYVEEPTEILGPASPESLEEAQAQQASYRAKVRHAATMSFNGIDRQAAPERLSGVPARWVLERVEWRCTGCGSLVDGLAYPPGQQPTNPLHHPSTCSHPDRRRAP